MKLGDLVLLRNKKWEPAVEPRTAVITAFDAWGNPKLLGFGFHKLFHKSQVQVVSSEAG